MGSDPAFCVEAQRLVYSSLLRLIAARSAFMHSALWGLSLKNNCGVRPHGHTEISEGPDPSTVPGSDPDFAAGAFYLMTTNLPTWSLPFGLSSTLKR